MKRVAFITLLILSGISSFGQKIRFSDSTNVWTILKTDGSGIPYTTSVVRNRIGGRVIIKGKVYMQLSDSYSYIREDTLTNKVFILPFNYSIWRLDSNETILYDYNLHIGDTIKHNVTYNSIAWVTQIDSTNINGLWYKVWSFRGADSGSIEFYYDIIEGIGCTFSFEYPLLTSNFIESCEQLICFSNKNAENVLSPPIPVPAIFSGPTVQFDNSASCTLYTDQIIQKSRKITVVPNPTNETSKIVFPHQIISGEVVIINELGEQVTRIPFENKEQVVIGDKIKIPGVYYYRVTDNISGETFSGTISK